MSNRWFRLTKLDDFKKLFNTLNAFETLPIYVAFPFIQFDGFANTANFLTFFYIYFKY